MDCGLIVELLMTRGKRFIGQTGTRLFKWILGN
jgi:hypothetical protein